LGCSPVTETTWPRFARHHAGWTRDRLWLCDEPRNSCLPRSGALLMRENDPAVLKGRGWELDDGNDDDNEVNCDDYCSMDGRKSRPREPRIMSANTTTSCLRYCTVCWRCWFPGRQQLCCVRRPDFGRLGGSCDVLSRLGQRCEMRENEGGVDPTRRSRGSWPCNTVHTMEPVSFAHLGNSTSEQVSRCRKLALQIYELPRVVAQQ